VTVSSDIVQSAELWNVRDLAAVIDCTDSTPG